MVNKESPHYDNRLDRVSKRVARVKSVRPVLFVPFAWLLLSATTLCGLRAEDGKATESAPLPPATPEQLEFFESKIRPILVEHCYECHAADAKKVQAGLRLDSRAGLLRGGDSGPALVVGKAEESLLIQAVRWKSLEMPPRGKLSDTQVQYLVDWVAQGAAWPSADAGKPAIAETTAAETDWQQVRAQHWAWQPPVRPTPPEVQQADWPKTAIDAFILHRLEAAGLRPAPVASPQVLIRRVFFDLIGLPPSPEEVDAFESAWARDPDAALSELVDRLLALPQYGERWGRHWLDVARYSDLTGTFGGPPVPHAWRYRDWVVSALNRDLPYDKFLRAQVAGDLMHHEDSVATGFFALGPTYVSDGGDPDATAQAMSETLDDRVDTLTRGILGLTVSCARCHDHKFDPIPQRDYYSLAGIFNNTRVADQPMVAPEVVKVFHDHQQAIQMREQKIRELEEAAKKENRELNDAERGDHDRFRAEIEQLRKQSPPPYPVANGLADTGSADMHVAIRGNLRKPGEVAPRRFLRVLSRDLQTRYSRGSGRLELADDLVAPDNPLTARVIVNRLWSQHFGQGIVRTLSNFGATGEPPSHPELLDWLAVELQSGGADPGSHGRFPASPAPAARWSLKRFHKLLIMSASYRMSSQADAQAMAVDADNRLLWRFHKRRLDVEAWRDSLLSLTGELDRTVSGPSVDNLMVAPRRTLYGAIDRNGDQFGHQTFLRLFDFPLARATSEGRITSTVPQQSLFLMNSPFMAARSRALAGKMHSLAADDEQRIRTLYRLLYSRLPSDEELELGRVFLAAASASSNTPSGEKSSLSRWEQYAQVLLSANELMYIE
ncbi:MAG: hypothetical protein RIS70_1365 [Planctomycetota bacterium]